MEILNFIFSSFWTFIGCFLLLILILEFVQTFFDFIVELIHGKAPVIVDKEIEKNGSEEERNN